MIRVVFVDDDKDVSELFKTVGELAQVWTVTFLNGSDALAFLEHNHADVVILDLILPILDGLTIVQELRRNESNYPDREPVEVVFLTGAEMNDAIELVATQTNVRKICQKPCDLTDLMDEIKSWFRDGQSHAPHQPSKLSISN